MTLATSPTLGEILRTQSGVISRQQALGVGLASTAIDNKLRSERWQRVHQGVYATYSGVPDRQAQLWAVVLRAGPQAVLTFRTAAELYGLVREPSPLIHVTVPRSQRIKPIHGAVIHHSEAVDRRRHPTLQPPRTRVEETVLDLTQVSANFDEAFDWLCRGVGRSLTTPRQLRAALQSRPRARWRGELLLALGDIAEGAHSLLERRYGNWSRAGAWPAGYSAPGEDRHREPHAIRRQPLRGSESRRGTGRASCASARAALGRQSPRQRPCDPRDRDGPVQLVRCHEPSVHRCRRGGRAPPDARDCGAAAPLRPVLLGRSLTANRAPT
jgi:hypothetical protein